MSKTFTLNSAAHCKGAPCIKCDGIVRYQSDNRCVRCANRRGGHAAGSEDADAVMIRRRIEEHQEQLSQEDYYFG